MRKKGASRPTPISSPWHGLSVVHNNTITTNKRNKWINSNNNVSSWVSGLNAGFPSFVKKHDVLGLIWFRQSYLTLFRCLSLFVYGLEFFAMNETSYFCVIQSGKGTDSYIFIMPDSELIIY